MCEGARQQGGADDVRQGTLGVSEGFWKLDWSWISYLFISVPSLGIVTGCVCVCVTVSVMSVGIIAEDTVG